MAVLQTIHFILLAEVSRCQGTKLNIRDASLKVKRSIIFTENKFRLKQKSASVGFDAAAAIVDFTDMSLTLDKY